MRPALRSVPTEPQKHRPSRCACPRRRELPRAQANPSGGRSHPSCPPLRPVRQDRHRRRPRSAVPAWLPDGWASDLMHAPDAGRPCGHAVGSVVLARAFRRAGVRRSPASALLAAWSRLPAAVYAPHRSVTPQRCPRRRCLDSGGCMAQQPGAPDAEDRSVRRQRKPPLASAPSIASLPRIAPGAVTAVRRGLRCTRLLCTHALPTALATRALLRAGRGRAAASEAVRA